MKGSDERNWRLLALLFRHGGDPNVLKKVVPEWGQERLQHFLRCQRLTSQRRTEQSVRCGRPKTTPRRAPGTRHSAGVPGQADRAPTPTQAPRARRFLSQWQAHIHNVQRVQGTIIKKTRKRRCSRDYCPQDHGPLLSKAMLIISQEEEHPKPSSSSEPDYSEIYRYLSQLLAGQEPTQLSQGSAAKVLEVMQKVQVLASHSLDLKSLYHHLSNNMDRYLQPWDAMGADSSPSTIPKGESASTLQQGESSSALPQGESPSSLPQRESSSTEMDECCCPLFLEVEDQARTTTEDLAAHDPRCEEVKERLAEKCRRKQEARSRRISELPGLNPFMLPPHLLHKPLAAAASALLER